MDQLVGVLFKINGVFIAIGVIEDGHGQTHFIDMSPAPDLGSDLLGFQIEINDVGHAPFEFADGLGKATALCGGAGLACEFLSHKV